MNRTVSRHMQPFANQDIRSLIQVRATTRPDHPYLVWRPFAGPRRAWTYAQFADRVARFAAGLHARGLIGHGTNQIAEITAAIEGGISGPIIAAPAMIEAA